MNIAPIVDLPVGSNLQDGLTSPFQFARKSPGPFHELMRFNRIVTPCYKPARSAQGVDNSSFIKTAHGVDGSGHGIHIRCIMLILGFPD
ncbi:hypothetical protein ACE103_10920 [Bradyrhizobium sp. ma5]|uniref:hypothetical protein n=1 Tax=Bradyrhizobium sp. ma5 TaxID=3344828 RepID=UPI0035D402F7